MLRNNHNTACESKPFLAGILIPLDRLRNGKIKTLQNTAK
jgi:hypothetical protein